MDVKSRLPGCAGQASFAVSAQTQVRVASLLKIPKSECLDFWIRLPKHKWPKSWSSAEDPVFSFWANSARSFFSRTVVGKASRESSFRTRMGKSSKVGNVYSSTEKKDYSCLCMLTFSNWLERTLTQCGKYSWKTLIWENRHHSLTMFIWVALKENVRQTKIL